MKATDQHDSRPRLSVAVIAKNEADRIGKLLQSVAFADDVVVVDSGSTDATVEICEAAGVRVIHQDWRGYVEQKQFALEAANGEWILNISDGSAGNDGVLRAWGFTLLTDIMLDADDEDRNGLPSDYHLSQCYPNPFNPETIIDYTLPRRSNVTIEIFNILGQKVKTLIDDIKPAGEYQVTWNGTDSNNQKVSTGLYFYRFQAGEIIDTRKMLLLK